MLEMHKRLCELMQNKGLLQILLTVVFERRLTAYCSHKPWIRQHRSGWSVQWPTGWLATNDWNNCERFTDVTPGYPARMSQWWYSIALIFHDLCDMCIYLAHYAYLFKLMRCTVRTVYIRVPWKRSLFPFSNWYPEIGCWNHNDRATIAKLSWTVQLGVFTASWHRGAQGEHPLLGVSTMSCSISWFKLVAEEAFEYIFFFLNEVSNTWKILEDLHAAHGFIHPKLMKDLGFDKC